MIKLAARTFLFIILILSFFSLDPGNCVKIPGCRDRSNLSRLNLSGLNLSAANLDRNDILGCIFKERLGRLGVPTIKITGG